MLEQILLNYPGFPTQLVAAFEGRVWQGRGRASSVCQVQQQQAQLPFARLDGGR